MSGHSKWATIRHKKGAADAKRGKVFSKFSKELTVAAKAGGGDPNSNPRLRTIIASARAVNMPSDNIERAIKKGTGELPGMVYEEVTYEGYAPGGVAILIEALTDNRNRTTAELRTMFNRGNGSLASSGSVAWMFHRKGQFFFDRSSVDEDQLLALALDAGADDMAQEDDQLVVSTSPEAFAEVAEAIGKTGLAPARQQLAYVPENMVYVEEEKTARQVLKLLEQLEDHDDVQNVYSNVDVPESIAASMEEE